MNKVLIFVTKWVGLGMAGLFALILLFQSAEWVVVGDRYNATVVKAEHIDVYDGNTGKFLTVKPETDSWLAGVDKFGNLDLRVQDSLSMLAWTTNLKRFSQLNVGDVVCMEDLGYRMSFLSMYPNAISYTLGSCN